MTKTSKLLRPGYWLERSLGNKPRSFFRLPLDLKLATMSLRDTLGAHDILVFCTCAILMIVSGAPYVFSAYSEALKVKLELTQFDMNLMSTLQTIGYYSSQPCCKYHTSY